MLGCVEIIQSNRSSPHNNREFVKPKYRMDSAKHDGIAFYG